jgi:hypothetical protein
VRELARLAATLLDAAASEDALVSGCRELYAAFHDAVGQTLRLGDGEGTRLASGYALDAATAAQCILDTKRTVAFLRGTWAALAELQLRFPRGAIEVVYAGCGPFAPLVVPLLPLLGESRFTFTLIDVHAAALQFLKALPNTRLVCADATQYRHRTPIHAVVTETMQQALTKEPFVAIVTNLRQQLHADGILIPQRVTVSAAAIDAECEQARWNGGRERHVDLGTLVEITRDSCGPIDPVTLTVPDLGAREHWLGLLTKVETFGGHALATYDSGLTMPYILWPASPLHSDDVFALVYRSGPSPGWSAAF